MTIALPGAYLHTLKLLQSGCNSFLPKMWGSIYIGRSPDTG